MSMTNVRLKFISPGGGGGILLGILDGGVPPGSPLSQRPLPVSAP